MRGFTRVTCVVGMRWKRGEKSTEKKEIVVFSIYYRGRGRAVGDGARTWVREKGKSMGNVGRGG